MYIYIYICIYIYIIPGRRANGEKKWDFVSVGRSECFKTRKQFTLLPYPFNPYQWIVYIEDKNVVRKETLAYTVKYGTEKRNYGSDCQKFLDLFCF